jgi:mannosyltransferase
VLRFPTLEAQSFWVDEAVTAVRVLKPSLLEMLAAVPSSESTPPLYYILAWAWTQLFGEDELGLRSLSALCGTLTVPVAYRATQQLVSRRAGLLAAALVATSPFLVWFSQEARAYVLGVLLAAVALLFFAKSLNNGRTRDYVCWGVASALALTTHYFTAFPFLAQGLWLAVRASNRRIVAAAAAGPVLTGVALALLAWHQRNAERTSWIADLPLAERLATSVRVFVTGPGFQPGWPLVVLIVLAGVALLFVRGDRSEKQGAMVAAGVVLATIALPLVLSLVGFDYFIDRNLIFGWVPLSVAVAAGFGVRQAKTIGLLAGGALVAVFAASSISAATDEQRQRPNWRAAAQAVGRPAATRAVAVPASSAIALKLYRPGLRPMSSRVGRISEVVFIGQAPGANGSFEEVPHGYRLIERRRLAAIHPLLLVRLRADKAYLMRPSALRAAGRQVWGKKMAVMRDAPPRQPRVRELEPL